MPTVEHIGTPSEANTTIGGVPIIHYFDFQSRGRGQVVRLLFEDAGIAYTDVRYSFGEYPEVQSTHPILSQNPTKSVPIIELDGKLLTQSYAILRHFARVLGAYDGKNEEEKYFADVICDIVVDWRTLFLAAFFSQNKSTDLPKHQQTTQLRFLHAIEQHLTTNPLSVHGPFVIGSSITYADLAVYQILHDEELVHHGNKGLEGYPRLAKLAAAVEERPGVKAFLESSRYRG
ncbi:glutathione S-transferase-like protein [Stereum hirsutum FP-91666 SS1]|uniref:glutathione S-transferase-like protein n=1 Tax=Stereum hirsutum (strain FP-91666) TaxID=721885 RepID=UPI000440E6FD|nr:glutathione S-transferase-like protein [Stereum hirsutum FP-91666 SS1]EIM91823.1 glutathione S-transferase-like protein [Stereum hirsutum FP-91666 SS1]